MVMVMVMLSRRSRGLNHAARGVETTRSGRSVIASVLHILGLQGSLKGAYVDVAILLNLRELNLGERGVSSDGELINVGTEHGEGNFSLGVHSGL